MLIVNNEHHFRFLIGSTACHPASSGVNGVSSWLHLKIIKICDAVNLTEGTAIAAIALTCMDPRETAP